MCGEDEKWSPWDVIISRSDAGNCLRLDVVLALRRVSGNKNDSVVFTFLIKIYCAVAAVSMS